MVSLPKYASIQRSYKDAKENYNHMSKWYDISEGIFEAYFRNLGVKLLDVQPDDEILEIGFGTGSALVEVAKLLKTGHVTGIEISPEMYQITSNKINRAGVEDRVNLILGNAITKKFGRYDKILFSFSLELFSGEDIRLLLSKCQSALTKAGSIVIVSLYKDEKPNFGVKLYEYFHFLFPKEIDCRPIPAIAIMKKLHYQIIKAKTLSMWGIPVIILKAKSHT